MWHFIFGNNRFFIRHKKTDLNTINNIISDTNDAEKIQLNDSYNEVDSSILPCAESETELNKLVSSHDSELL